MATEKKPPLRERKYAQTKLALLNAAVKAIEEAPLNDIAVKDLCEEAEVSEATFFNYFTKKSELLDYYTQLWNLELSWHHQRSESSGLALIEESFNRIAKKFQLHPGVMAEIISHQAYLRNKPQLPEIGRAERVRAFPKLEGIVEQKLEGLDRMWATAVQQAISTSDLPSNTHMPTAIIGLASIFYGVPLALGQGNLSTISTMYRQQLNIYWMGIKGINNRT